MKKFGFLLSLSLLALTPFNFAVADDHAGRDDAIAMVKTAIADIKSKDAQAVYTEISNTQGKYIKGDLYLVAYDLTGKCIAHGQNAALVGKNLLPLKDVDGKAFVQERIDMAKTQQNFWQDYKYMNPTTHAVAAKQSYCEKISDAVICGGIYK